MPKEQQRSVHTVLDVLGVQRTAVEIHLESASTEPEPGHVAYQMQDDS